MKRTISPLLAIGLIIFAIYIITDRFFVKISNGIAIPLLLVVIVLIIAGGLKSKKKT